MDLTLAIAIIGLFLGVLAYFYKHAQTMKGYEDKLKELGKRLDTFAAVQKSFVDASHKTFLALITSLTKSEVIKNEDFPELLKVFVDSLGESYKIAMSSLESTNPLSEDEKRRLRKYAERAKKGERFSHSDAEDFYNLSKKLSEEKGSDAGAWILLLLAAFILGLILGSKD